MLTEASIKRPAVNPDLSASTAEIAAVPLTFLIEIRTLGAQCVDLKRSTRVIESKDMKSREGINANKYSS
ncbi:hypothetical protein F9C07_2284689 [Aspergillus flavus]|uniref:Uncharacterized protein n=1 Tax=Aspergillus flavus (strain ATCC 200026 / FGSC A1120 / IAM 13836 / NRRL 3357 / JCM 12722 / SRRC 167) TaxID=332952 RepID=A0A7U2MIQ2_ASPFN|nr:hypothetical protein F9C07_2284689 [Aspergillus flavus]